MANKPTLPNFVFFIRMRDLPAPAPKRITIPYLDGPRRMFAVEEGFVGITSDSDADALKAFQANGEIPERGGLGGPLFDVVDQANLIETLQREHEQTLLQRGTGTGGMVASTALQNMLRLGIQPSDGRPVPTAVSATAMPRSAAEILAAKRQATAPAAEPTTSAPAQSAPKAAPQEEEPTFGKRKQRRKGGSVTTQPQGG